MRQAYDKLKALLAELFQFDREGPGFGIYRIVNHKREELEVLFARRVDPVEIGAVRNPYLRREIGGRKRVPVGGCEGRRSEGVGV